jgi:hypothetical protein
MAHSASHSRLPVGAIHLPAHSHHLLFGSVPKKAGEQASRPGREQRGCEATLLMPPFNRVQPSVLQPPSLLPYRTTQPVRQPKRRCDDNNLVSNALCVSLSPKRPCSGVARCRVWRPPPHAIDAALPTTLLFSGVSLRGKVPCAGTPSARWRGSPRWCVGAICVQYEAG